jgi:hypothetical protein
MRFVATTRIESLTTELGLAAFGGVHWKGAIFAALTNTTVTPMA